MVGVVDLLHSINNNGKLARLITGVCDKTWKARGTPSIVGAALRPDHLVSRSHVFDSLSFVYCAIFWARCITLYPLVKSFTAPRIAQCCWPNITTKHAAAAVLTIAVYWTFQYFDLPHTVVFHISPFEVFVHAHTHTHKIAKVSNIPFDKYRNYIWWMTNYLSRQFSKQIWLFLFCSCHINLSFILPLIVHAVDKLF